MKAVFSFNAIYLTATFLNASLPTASFTGCNLANIKLGNDNLEYISFKECKLIGVNFSECNDFLFSVRFENCLLDYASFAKRTCRKLFFTKLLKGVSFSSTNLSHAHFDQTDLAALFLNKQILQAPTSAQLIILILIRK